MNRHRARRGLASRKNRARKDDRSRVSDKRCKNRPDFTPFVSIISNGENNDVFLHHFFRMKVLLIDMSSVRWCGTADVAGPRPREVGGACRRQVLAGARTQETVGGPNVAQRSELRRTAPPDDKRYHDWQSFPDMSWISVVGHACMTLTNAPGLSDVVHMVVLPHQYATDASA